MRKTSIFYANEKLVWSPSTRPIDEHLFRGGHETFLHKGTNERWRDALTEADLELYEKRAHSALSPRLFNWLRNGRRVAGDPVSMPD